MQLKARMEEESPEARQERLLNEQYEKEEWKTLTPHTMSSDESKEIVEDMLQSDKVMEENRAVEKYSAEEYMSLLTAGINKEEELPYAIPELKPFLTKLQSSSDSLSTVVGELFQKQQILPFSFLQEFFTKVSRENLLEVLKGLSIHICRGLFALNADRLYRTERNQKALRNARNEVLKILRQLGSWQYISRENIDKHIQYPRQIVNKVLKDVAENDDNKWRLKFSEYGIDNFEEIVSVDPLAFKQSEMIAVELMQHIKQERKSEGEHIESIMLEELKKGGIMTYMQLLNLAKQKVNSDMYSLLEPTLEKVITSHATFIKNVIIYSTSSDPILQEVRNAMVKALKETQVWKKPELKKVVDEELGEECTEAQFSKVLKELCKLKAKKWCLKYYDP